MDAGDEHWQLYKNIERLMVELGMGEPKSSLSPVVSMADQCNPAPSIVTIFTPPQVPKFIPAEEKGDKFVPPPLTEKLSNMTFPELKHSIETLLKQPLCAERSLELLIYYVQCLHRFSAQEFNFEGYEDVATATESLFAVLEQRLKLEKLDAREIMQAQADIRVRIRAAEWKTATNKLIALLRALRPFDMMEMLRLWEHSKDAGRRIDGKDIILFLGETGAGKSTVIHFLAGSEMKEVDDPSIAGYKSIRPIRITNPDLRGVNVALNNAKSETRFVSAVEVKLMDVGIAKSGSVFLCDTPGFGDTGGPEVDVANGLGLVDALRTCKSVKPFILSSIKDAGGKGQGLKRIAYRISSMVPGVHKYLDAFSYAFVRYPVGENPFKTLKDLIESMTPMEEADVTFTRVLVDMIGKITNLEDQIQVPLLGGQPKARELMETLIKGEKIGEPAGVFKFSAQEESTIAMRAQMAKFLHSITVGLELREYPFVLMKLDELKKAFEALDQTFIDDTYKQVCRLVDDSINFLFAKCYETLSRGLRDGNELTQEDVFVYTSTLELLEQTRALRRSHLPDSEDRYEGLQKFLREQASQLADAKDQDLTSTLVAGHVKKLKLLSETIPEIVPMFTATKEAMVNRVREYRDNAELALAKALTASEIKVAEGQEAKQNLFDEFARTTQILNFASKNFAGVMLLESGDMIPSFLAALRTHSCAKDQVLQQSAYPMANAFVEQLKQIASTLEDARSCITLSSQLSPSSIVELDSIAAVFFDKLITGGSLQNSFSFDKFQRLIEEVLNKAKSPNSDALYIQTLGELVLEVDKIRSISQMIKYNKELDERYRVLVGRVRGHILLNMQLVKRFLDSFSSDTERTWDSQYYKRLPAVFAQLKNATWIGEINDGAHKGDVAHLDAMNIEGILEHVRRLKEEATSLRLELSSPEEQGSSGAVNLRHAGQSLSKIKKIVVALQETDCAIQLKQEEADFERWLTSVTIPQLNAILQDFDLGEKKNVVATKFSADLAKLMDLKARCEELHQHRQFLLEKNFDDIAALTTQMAKLKEDRNAQRGELDGLIEEERHELMEYQFIMKQASKVKSKTIYLEAKGWTEVTLEKKIAVLVDNIEKNETARVSCLEDYEERINNLRAVESKWTELSHQPNNHPAAMQTLQSAHFNDFEELEQALRSVRQTINDLNPMDIKFRMDFQLLEIALEYVEVCRTLPCLAPQVGAIALQLKKNMHDYGDSIKDQIELCLRTIIIAPSDVSSKGPATPDLITKAQLDKAAMVKILFDRLKELKTLSGIPALVKCFPSDFPVLLMEESFRRLGTYHRELSYALPNFSLQQANDLHACLTHIHVLEALDELLGKDVKFATIYEYNSIKMFDNVADLTWLSVCTDTHDYSRIKLNMNVLAENPVFSNTFDEARKTLSRWLNNYLLQIVEMLPAGSNLGIIKIRAVIGDLKNVGQAKLHVYEYLDRQTQGELDLIGDRARTSLQEYITRATAFIEASIRAGGFEEAEKRRDMLVRVIAAMRGFPLSVEVQARVNNLDQYLTYRFKLVGEYYAGIPTPTPSEEKRDEIAPDDILQKKIRQVEDDQMHRAGFGLDFKLMGFVRYRLAPPKDIFTGLEKMRTSEFVSDIYIKAETDLREIVSTRFRTAFQDMVRNPTGENGIKQKSDLEGGLRLLPDILKDQLHDEFINAMADLDQSEQQRRALIEKAVLSNDVRTIEQQFAELEIEGMEGFKSELESKVVAQCIILHQEVIQELAQNGLLAALHGVKVLFEYKRRFSHVDKLGAQFSVLVKEVNSFFDKSSDALIAAFSGSVVPIPSSEGAKLETYYTNVLICFDLLLGKSHSSIDVEERLSSELFPRNFCLELRALSTVAAEHFQKAMGERDLAVLAMDPQGLQNAIDFSRSWDAFVKKVCQKDFSGLPDMQPINELVTSLHSSFIDSVTLVALIRTKIQEHKNRCSQSFSHPATQGFDAERAKFYTEINGSFQTLKRLKDQSGFELTACASECHIEAKKSMKLERKALAQHFRGLAKRKVMNLEDSRQFSMLQKNLLSIQACIPEFNLLIQNGLLEVETFFAEKLEAIVNRGQAHLNVAELSVDLIKLAAMVAAVPMFAERVHQAIDTLLSAFDKQFADQGSVQMDQLQELSDALQASSYGEEIARAHRLFQSCRDRTRVAATKQQNIFYVIKEIEGDNINHSDLTMLFNDFLQSYNSSLQSVLKSLPGDRVSRVVAEVVTTVADLKGSSVNPSPQERQSFTTRMGSFLSSFGLFSEPTSLPEGLPPFEFKAAEQKELEVGPIPWTPKIREIVLKLLEKLFVLWTLQRSQKVLEKNVDIQWLPAPHPVQVVALLRLMGFGYDDSVDKFRLGNTLLEIRTGEGKSLVLGVAAAIFALLGFSVSCASYSQYLSNRDWQDFLPLFDALNVTRFINYGTLNQLCEQILNEEGKLSDQVQTMIAGGQVESKKTKNRNTILLIDEVDVVFSNDFLGRVYTPETEIKDEQITVLVDHLWTMKDKFPSLATIKESSAYKNCVLRFKDWAELLDEAIKDMLMDLKDFDGKNHIYLVDHDRICYKAQDSISDKVVIRYKTLFAYYLEKERGNISESSWREQIKLTIACGSYSYAQIVQYFDHMMGVSGTLKNINSTRMQALAKDFNIRRQTYLPSAYGKSQLQFFPNTDLKIFSKLTGEYFLGIASQITEKLRDNHRAVLVCFEDKKTLMEFWDSETFSQFRSSAQKMTEASEAEQAHLVTTATRAGQVTLITRSFGRGTNFLTGDPVVRDNGGVHVLQAFVSEDKAEEIQICERTARQGQPGSYGMVLARESLEVLFGAGLSDEIKAESGGKIYDRINDARNNASEARYRSDKSGGEARKHVHLASMRFLVDLRKNNVLGVKQALRGLNKGSIHGTSVSPQF